MSLTTTSSVSNSIPTSDGSAAQQEYSVAVAQKAQEAIKQDGAAINKLLETQPTLETEGKVGTRFYAYA